MKKIEKSLLRLRAKWPNGEVVTCCDTCFVTTTEQLQPGHVYAATHAYLITRETDTHYYLKTHPTIKGTKPR